MLMDVHKPTPKYGNDSEHTILSCMVEKMQGSRGPLGSV